MNNRKLISILETYNMKNGTRTVIKEFAGRIEAPNWTADGYYLIYNANGHLYSFDLKSKKSTQIDTGSCDSCNNDHVLSPDGKRIGISSGCDGSPDSRIWVLPLEGGLPQLITEKCPSYLHGWSPDGSTLAYCAERNQQYDIYVTNMDHKADERPLTNNPALDDGPEYSPDGKYIWFHSTRTGLAQIWRMNADGSNQTQMTFDLEWNNWFPHISPDNKYIVFLAYRKGDVNPNTHPADKNVAIRMINKNGGESITLIELLGGQGTMNVNAWAPDRNCFAFVSYRYDDPF